MFVAMVSTREDSDCCMETVVTKRGLMDAAQSGVEVRKLHVIYFLSRKGHIEDPHLIRVHHLSRNGIHLRDVKKWLAELRGKDMPESFAWAYKKKYMKGFVWQDLVDDDLITPHFNNEYVLKGSQISSSFTSTQDTKVTEGNVSMRKESLLEEAKEKPLPKEPLTKGEIEEELPESTLTDDFMKVEEKYLDTIEQEISKEFNKVGESYTSLYLKIFNNKKAKKMSEGAITMGNANESEKSSSRKSKSNGNVNMFRNFITCRTADTNDSVIVTPVHRQRKLSVKKCSGEAKNECLEVSKLHQRANGNYSFNLPRNVPSCDGEAKSTSFCNPRKSSAAYMPVNGPTCSQCGKQFKPEKLHRHMQSCKGMKAIAKGLNSANNASAEILVQNAAEISIEKQSVSTYLLSL